jgi:hypothetical protein
VNGSNVQSYAVAYALGNYFGVTIETLAIGLFPAGDYQRNGRIKLGTF